MLQREAIIGRVAEAAVDEMEGRCLVVNDMQYQIQHPNADRWNRYAFQRKSTQLWPKGEYDHVLIRMSPEKNAMEMMVHAALSVLCPNGKLWIVGGNDEGAKSLPKRFASLLPGIETIDIRKRSRVLCGVKPEGAMELRGTLEDWWQKERFLDHDWFSLPGCFAKGKLDAGTKLLLDVIPGLKANRRVLDYASGIGVISHQVRRHFPEVPIDGIDFDSYGVESARRNMPDASFFVSDGWQSLPNDRRYDLIISNPPLHLGKSEDRTVLNELISGAKSRLFRQGSLVVVAQRQIPLEHLLSEHFPRVEQLTKNNHFWVWCAKL